MTLWPSSSVALKFEMYPSSFRMRAISTFSREAGTSTFWCRACSALRTLVSISATGSVNLIVCFSSRHPFAPRSAENLRRLSQPYHLHIAGQKPTIDLLPGRLRHAGNFPAQRQPAEAQAAQAEFAQVSARPPANLAAVVPARGKLGSLRLGVPRHFKLLFNLRVFNSFGCSHEILCVEL